jgi:hypothetical protein
MEVVLGHLNRPVELSVAMVVEGREEGDVVGKDELDRFHQAGMQE